MKIETKRKIKDFWAELCSDFDNAKRNRKVWNEARLMAINSACVLRKRWEFNLFTKAVYDAMVWGILSDPNFKAKYEHTERGINAWVKKIGTSIWTVEYRLPNEYEIHRYPKRARTLLKANQLSEYIASDEFLDKIIHDRLKKGEPYEHLLKRKENVYAV